MSVEEADPLDLGRAALHVGQCGEDLLVARPVRKRTVHRERILTRIGVLDEVHVAVACADVADGSVVVRLGGDRLAVRTVRAHADERGGVHVPVVDVPVRISGRAHPDRRVVRGALIRRGAARQQTRRDEGTDPDQRDQDDDGGCDDQRLRTHPAALGRRAGRRLPIGRIRRRVDGTRGHLRGRVTRPRRLLRKLRPAARAEPRAVGNRPPTLGTEHNDPLTMAHTAWHRRGSRPPVKRQISVKGARRLSGPPETPGHTPGTGDRAPGTPLFPSERRFRRSRGMASPSRGMAGVSRGMAPPSRGTAARPGNGVGRDDAARPGQVDARKKAPRTPGAPATDRTRSKGIRDAPSESPPSDVTSARTRSRRTPRDPRAGCPPPAAPDRTAGRRRASPARHRRLSAPRRAWRTPGASR